MICFCHQSLQPLRLALPALNVSASIALPNANLALALANWLGARALPAPAWMPDPAWLGLTLPRMSLSANAMATISALAQLRAPVDAFFDKVTVNVAETELRRNRLQLLAKLRDTMHIIADFSKIEG